MKHLLRAFWSMYRPNYATVLIYMLQNTEYQVHPYIVWVQRTHDFSAVMKRRTLVRTRAARLLLAMLRGGIALQWLAGLLLVYLGATGRLTVGVPTGIIVILLIPFVWAYAIALPLLAGRYIITRPKQRTLVRQSETVFAQHKGVKIAVAGSYGKTTVKELLSMVLSEGLKVAATPANKNVAVSHAHFAQGLTGDEDVLIIEYGEGEPGDVMRFARTTHPTHGVITGLAPAHLDHYKTLQAAGKDIFSLAAYLQGKNVYVNDESPAIRPFVHEGYHTFNRQEALGWEVRDTAVEITGLDFTMTKNGRTLALHSGLLGRHLVAPLAFVAALALELGLTKEQVRAGIAKTYAFQHRMQPYQLGGAWVIDDTYNGNIEGVRAGTGLLAELPAVRKIYVTPGLVDQGEETRKVHEEMGRLIAQAHPDIVVLMQNSVTPYIETGLSAAKYRGEIREERDPLGFYTNLEHFVAAGDLVLMQNDWTDNYA